MSKTKKEKAKNPINGDGKLTAGQEELAGQKPAPGERGGDNKSSQGNGVKTDTESAGQSADEEVAKGGGISSAESESRYLRLRAEYDNHIKRTTREKNELMTYAGGHMIRKILPILDDLRRTIEHAKETESKRDDPVLRGVELIIDKFTKLLEAEGVETIGSVGQEFNPDLHEALMSRSSKEYPKGIIIEEYEPGYKYRDKVIRHAKVVVSG